MPNASSRSQFKLSKLQRAVRTHFLARRPREEGVSSLRLSGKHAPLQRAAGALLGIALAPSAEILNSQRLKAGSEFAGRRQHPLGVTQQPLHQQVRTTAPISSQVFSTCRSQQEGSAGSPLATNEDSSPERKVNSGFFSLLFKSEKTNLL